MSCAAFQDLWGAVAEFPPAPGTVSALEDHARTCEDCTALLRLVDRLERGRQVFSAPDPEPAYWVSFTSRLEGRLRSGEIGIRAFLLPGWSARLSLAFGALGLAVLVVMAVRQGGGIERPATSAAQIGMRDGFHQEAELLDRLGQAGPENLNDALDIMIPPEPPPSPNDLAADLGSIAEATEWRSFATTLYDRFLDMPALERARFMKEMRREIG